MHLAGGNHPTIPIAATLLFTLFSYTIIYQLYNQSHYVGHVLLVIKFGSFFNILFYIVAYIRPPDIIKYQGNEVKSIDFLFFFMSYECEWNSLKRFFSYLLCLYRQVYKKYLGRTFV